MQCARTKRKIILMLRIMGMRVWSALRASTAQRVREREEREIVGVVGP